MIKITFNINIHVKLTYLITNSTKTDLKLVQLARPLE
jgi:hypothetical protein